MHETTKAIERRLKQDRAFWYRILRGKALDIGSGPDPLSTAHTMNLDCVTTFDMQDGDANRIDEYFPAESFDLVHASQCLEHMHNPADAFRRWASLVAPGGTLVITVPAYELYERIGADGVSLFNGDHKSTWSLWQQEAPTILQHVHVPSFLADPANFPGANRDAWVIKATLEDTGYDYLVGTSRDQTLHDGAEAFIEIIAARK